MKKYIVLENRNYITWRGFTMPLEKGEVIYYYDEMVSIPLKGSSERLVKGTVVEQEIKELIIDKTIVECY